VLRKAVTVILFVLMAALLCTPLLARLQAAQHSAPVLNRVYDKSSVVTINGTVQEVITHNCSLGWKHDSSTNATTNSWQGIHVILGTPYGRVDAHLGPTWYLKQLGFQPKRRDLLNAIGSKFSLNGTTVLITREIREGDRVYFLRDMDGEPLWTFGTQSARASPVARFPLAPLLLLRPDNSLAL